MEEVDGIIIYNLKTIGCDIEDDVRSIHQFSTQLIVEATARCLRVISNNQDLPHRLPPSMAARFRVGATLATALQEQGYRGEVGYQTFLYSNEADIRRIFMFLLEKLPKESTESAEETLGSSALLRRSIAAELKKRLQSPWTPPFCKQRGGLVWRGDPPQWQREGAKGMTPFHASPLSVPEGLHDVSKKIPKAIRSYYTHCLRPICCQPKDHAHLAASLLEANAVKVTAQQEWENEWNSLGLSSRLTPEEYCRRKRQRVEKRMAEQLNDGIQAAAATDGSQDVVDLAQLVTGLMDRTANTTSRNKGSRFTHTEKLQFTEDEEKTAAQVMLGSGEGSHAVTEEEVQQGRQQELQNLSSELAALSSQLESLTSSQRQQNASQQQMEDSLASVTNENQQRQETYRVKKRTLDLLPDAENNIDKLQTVVDSSTQRLVHLAGQWEKRRVPLVEQYRQLRAASDDKTSETEKKLEEMRELRERLKTTATEARGKEDVHKQLLKEYERMTKDVNRSAYTRRILEIVSNIKKQKKQIDKILVDTRSIQKEINQLHGKLDRTFTVTDELIFRDAKRDEAVRKSYKFLAGLHDNCEIVRTTVEDTGVILREIRDLEDQIEQEGKKKIMSNLEQITSDYQEMKKENMGLMAKLKQAKS